MTTPLSSTTFPTASQRLAFTFTVAIVSLFCPQQYTPIGTNIAELTLHATDVDLYENAYIVYTCTQPAPVFVNAITGVVTLSTTLNRLVINQYPLVREYQHGVLCH